MRDVFFILYHAGYGTTLYVKLLTTPDLFILWHNTHSGAFYPRVGCTNCPSATPQGMQGKALKQSEEVQQAFRSFLARILEDRNFLQEEKCRHLHMDVPPRLALPQQIE